MAGQGISTDGKLLGAGFRNSPYGVFRNFRACLAALSRSIAQTAMEASVNYSIATADLATHVKVVAVSLALAVVVANIVVALA